MLPEIRSDSLHFGNRLFLDSQKRKYKIAGWPSIGPVIKDSEMKVLCIAESIVVEESHSAYVWITQMLVEMETRYSLDQIQIIFGDQALTNQILIDLGLKIPVLFKATTTFSSMRYGLPLLEFICIKESRDIWIGCCWVQRMNGKRLIHPQKLIF
jgi:hypothetical protein